MIFQTVTVASLILAGAQAKTPSDELFQALRDADTPAAAQRAEQDIWAAWMVSGSPTVDLLMERGVAAQASGETELAREMYDRAIQILPDYAEAWNRRATLFLAEENYEEALQDLNTAIENEPRHFGAWLGVGMIFSTLGAYDQALDAYREALKIHPNLEQAKQAERRLAPLYDGRTL